MERDPAYTVKPSRHNAHGLGDHRESQVNINVFLNRNEKGSFQNPHGTFLPRRILGLSFSNYPPKGSLILFELQKEKGIFSVAGKKSPKTQIFLYFSE